MNPQRWVSAFERHGDTEGSVRQCLGGAGGSVAKEYGLSNVGLGKACRRHGIPVPPRGYWARKAAGQALVRPRLPAAKDGRESLTLWGARRSVPSPNEVEHVVHPLLAFETDPQNRIRVPDELRIRHPALAQTKAYWATQKRGDLSYGDTTLPRLNVSVGKETRPRALRLLQALFAALEQRGHTAAATKEGKTTLTVLGEAFEISLREPSKQVRHVPTSQELANAKRYSWMRPPPYDLVSSGTLVLTIENFWGARRMWKDGKRQRLEDVLNSVMAGLIEAALYKKAAREKRSGPASDSKRSNDSSKQPDKSGARSGPGFAGWNDCGRRPMNTSVFARS
jgi:hypothetical protein